MIPEKLFARSLHQSVGTLETGPLNPPIRSWGRKGDEKTRASYCTTVQPHGSCATFVRMNAVDNGMAGVKLPSFLPKTKRGSLELQAQGGGIRENQSPILRIPSGQSDKQVAKTALSKHICSPCQPASPTYAEMRLCLKVT